MPKKFEWTIQRLQEIKERIPLEGPKPLALEWGLGVAVICKRARELEIKTPRARTQFLNRITLNELYFLTWTPQMAYDLGNGFADGSIEIDHWSRFRYKLAVQTLDEQLIIGTRDRIGSHHNLRRTKEISEWTGNPVLKTSVNITNHNLAKSLNDHYGMVPNKSELDVELPKIPIEHLSHFVRGFLDGDGCISHSHLESPKRTFQLYFQGSPKFILSLQNILLLNIKELKEPSLTNYQLKTEQKRITWASLGQLKVLYNYLYPSGNYPFLIRKREKLELILRTLSK